MPDIVETARELIRGHYYCDACMDEGVQADGVTPCPCRATETNTWVRVDSGQRPRAHLPLIIHTPQYEDSHGEGVTGYWNGQEFIADDERNLLDFPPVHFMIVSFPEYKGSEEDWKNVIGEPDPYEDDSEEGDADDDA